MTGAPMPTGADAVVVIERTQITSDGRVEIRDKPPQQGQNFLTQGKEVRQGDIVVRAGTILGPQEVGVLATVGCARPRLYSRPRVAILPTGDEVVDASQTPGPGQIRNGNGPMLMIQVQRAGGLPAFLGIARDNRQSLERLISEGLRSPVLVLSGGVSAGKLDLVPEVLSAAGVQAHFHKIQIKPGKPLLFGTRGSSLVFGLPGNPVSSLVCFELFVRPAIRKLMGDPAPEPRTAKAKLTADFHYRTDRPTFFPVRLTLEEGRLQFGPVRWQGSSDLSSVVGSNAFAVFSPEREEYHAGEMLDVLIPDGQAVLWGQR
jgi:molybdopterin molybdotransferase